MKTQHTSLHTSSTCCVALTVDAAAGALLVHEPGHQRRLEKGCRPGTGAGAPRTCLALGHQCKGGKVLLLCQRICMTVGHGIADVAQPDQCI